MSTCYVNCEKLGFIQEKIYDIAEDSEAIVEKITKMTVPQQEEQLKNILGPWPNTYTFTKSMAERTLRKRRPQNMPVVLLRPAIISGSIREPFPGWTDTVSAAGGLSIAGGTGLLEFVNGDVTNIADIIPVDYVSNAIIVSTALLANKPGLTVVHSSSSHQNPITWSGYLTQGYSSVEKQPFSMQLAQPKIYFIKNTKLLKALYYWRSKFPAMVIGKVAKIPGIGSPKLASQMGQLQEAYKKLDDLYDLFKHFTMNEWIYET